MSLPGFAAHASFATNGMRYSEPASEEVSADCLLPAFRRSRLPVLWRRQRQAASGCPVAAPGRDRAGKPLDAVRLTPLMEVSGGRPDLLIGLVDGPVDQTHPDLVVEHIRELPGTPGGQCVNASSIACAHGTFVAGMFSARRGGAAAAICPDCTLV